LKKKFFYAKLPPKMNLSQKALYKIFPKVSPWSQEGSTRSKSLRYFRLQKKKTGGKLFGWCATSML
jgi:hypothetical protein